MGKTLYHKSVKELFRDLMTEASHPMSKQEIIDYFSENYPLVQENTVTDHIYWLSANYQKRTSMRKVNPNGDDDIIYRTPDDLYRLYDPANDGPAVH